MTERFVVANGIRIFCVDEGDGPLVLLLHGFPESSYSWRHQVPALAAAGFRAVAIDLPGYGRSDKPDVAYNVSWVGACVAGVITGLGHERAVVAGHDWGGLIAWPFARMYPDLVAGVIGLNVPDLPRYDLPPTELFRQLGSSRTQYILDFQERGTAEDNIQKDIDGFVELFLRGPATVRKDVMTNDVLAEYAALFRPEGAITPPLEYYRNMDRNWEIAAEFDDDKIDVPCLMICAAGDPVLPPELAEGMDARVPDVEIVTIDDCGHWTQQEQPEATNQHMLRYLARVPRW
ncbi:MAG TPA: alpha/beta hydrolase [Actinomycetota bacterium]|nr:alpha/beta hydrolase [Actinomycetota bacterium]